MSTALLVRPAATRDLQTLVGIQEAASVRALAHIFPPERYPFPTEAVQERWQDALGDSDVEVLVAEQDGEIVGQAAVRRGWLDGLYVLPDRWGSGIARSLHDEAVERLRNLGCSSARLWVLERNDRARRFYERRGWQADGRTRVVPFPPRPLDVGYTLELA